MNIHTYIHAYTSYWFSFSMPVQLMARLWSNRNSHLFLVEMQNGSTILEDNMVVF